MGATLPKDLINAERSKLITHEGIYLRKSFDLDNFRNIEQDDLWDKVTIKVHLAKLECTFNGEVEIFPINCNFLIINQNHSNKETVIAFMDQKKI